jgi:hypothetical protein
MVEIIPKEAPKPSKGASALLYFAIFLLLLTAGGYFVLNNYLQKAEDELASLKLEVSQIMTQEKTALEQEILTSKGEIDNFSSLIEQHLEPSMIFEIIQRATHPQVWFGKLDFDPRRKVFEVSGETQSFESLGQQILIMEEDEAIDKVDLKTVSISKEGGIEFNMSFSLSESVF